MSTAPESTVASLAELASSPSVDTALLREYLDFAADAANAHRETSVEQHLTVSAFVFDETREHVLLCYHRKGRFWLQLGGHLELDDRGLLEAARREAVEEGGIAALHPLADAPVDVDRHALASGFGTCRVHWDVGFAFGASLEAVPTTSEESEDVAWWPVSAPPAGAVAGLGERIARVLVSLDGRTGLRSR